VCFAINNGSSAVFQCTALADPEHQVSWSFNSSSGNISERIAATDSEMASSNNKYAINRTRDGTRFGELTVNNVMYEDCGTYTCLAENRLGMEEAKADLTVHGKPVKECSS